MLVSKHTLSRTICGYILPHPRGLCWRTSATSWRSASHTETSHRARGPRWSGCQCQGHLGDCLRPRWGGLSSRGPPSDGSLGPRLRTLLQLSPVGGANKHSKLHLVISQTGNAWCFANFVFINIRLAMCDYFICKCPVFFSLETFYIKKFNRVVLMKYLNVSMNMKGLFISVNIIKGPLIK